MTYIHDSQPEFQSLASQPIIVEVKLYKGFSSLPQIPFSEHSQRATRDINDRHCKRNMNVMTYNELTPENGDAYLVKFDKSIIQWRGM